MIRELGNGGLWAVTQVALMPWTAKRSITITSSVRHGGLSSSTKGFCGRNAPGPRLACPTGSQASRADGSASPSAQGGKGRKVGLVEIRQLADEPWAPVAQGHPGAEVVR